jgi:hypothetical protein
MAGLMCTSQVDEFIAAASADLDEMVNLERFVLGDDLIA